MARAQQQTREAQTCRGEPQQLHLGRNTRAAVKASRRSITAKTQQESTVSSILHTCVRTQGQSGERVVPASNAKNWTEKRASVLLLDHASKNGSIKRCARTYYELSEGRSQTCLWWRGSAAAFFASCSAAALRIKSRTGEKTLLLSKELVDISKRTDGFPRPAQ